MQQKFINNLRISLNYIQKIIKEILLLHQERLELGYNLKLKKHNNLMKNHVIF